MGDGAGPTRSTRVERILWATVATAGLVVVLASPLALVGLDRLASKDWQRLSDIGETYGAVSAVLSAIALAGVVVSLRLQRHSAELDRASAQLDREQAHRAMHLDLVRMAIEDPSLMAAWGQPETNGLPLEVVRQRTYCNQLVLWWEMSFEVGAVTDEWIRYIARELFKGDVSRQWWKDVRDHRYAYATPRKLRVLGILNEECGIADATTKQSTAAVPGPRSDDDAVGGLGGRVSVDLRMGQRRLQRVWVIGKVAPSDD